MNEKTRKEKVNSKEKREINGLTFYRKHSSQIKSYSNNSMNFFFDDKNVDFQNDVTFDTPHESQISHESGDHISSKFNSNSCGLKKNPETAKLLITKNEIVLKGYNYVRQEILRKSKNSDIHLMILKYADIVLEHFIGLNKFPYYKKTFIRKTKQQKIIDLFEGKDYVSKEGKFFETIKKYREYEALIYEIRCKKKFPKISYQHKGYYGYTRSTKDIRFTNHIIEAIEQFISYKKKERDNPPTMLNRAIIIALKDMGHSIRDLFLSIQSSNIEEQFKLSLKITKKLKADYFNVHVLEFHKKLETAVKREIQLIADNNYIKIGLNECGGGQGGLPYIFLPLYDIAGMVMLGCTQEKITEIINKFYSNDFMNSKIGLNTFRRRIIEECGNWVNAQRLFLKPVVEALRFDCFSDKKIHDTLSTPHTKEGWIYKWWKKGHKLDFDFWINSQRLDFSNKNERFFNPAVKYCGIPRSIWEEWVIKGISNKKISEISGLPFNTIVSVYKHNFGGRNKILFKYRREVTIEMRKKGMRLKTIYTDVFKKTYFPSNFKRDFMTWFNGMTPGEIEETWKSAVD
jgi:hypothetical protein